MTNPIGPQRAAPSSPAHIAAEVAEAGRPATTGPTWDEVARHEHTEGPWCWILADVVKLADPVACSGSQGLFSLQGRVLERIAEQVRGRIKLA